jgi:hypothetical protein
MEILFNKTIEQCRQLGARGGRVHARNLRLRPSHPVTPQTLAVIHPLTETAAQASRVLDAQFPWLRGAEKRCAPRRPQRTISDPPVFPPSPGEELVAARNRPNGWSLQRCAPDPLTTGAR